MRGRDGAGMDFEMMRRTFHRAALGAVALVAGLTGAACTPPGDAGQGAALLVDGANTGLERVALTIEQDGATHRFTVEVADTPERQATGMMHRAAMLPDEGMLFPFPRPRIASFWMKNTLIPLDMIFVRADGSIDRIAENTVPHSLEPVSSGGEVAAVLELAGGTAARLGLTEQAVVRWK